MSPRYAPGSERQVHGEFLVFQTRHPDEAVEFLSSLHYVAVAGWGGLDGERRDRCGAGLARPYCWQAFGWGLFFEVEGPWNGPCVVTLLLAVEFAAMPIDPAKGEAIRRWNAARSGGPRS